MDLTFATEESQLGDLRLEAFRLKDGRHVRLHADVCTIVYRCSIDAVDNVAFVGLDNLVLYQDRRHPALLRRCQCESTLPRVRWRVCPLLRLSQYSRSRYGHRRASDIERIDQLHRMGPAFSVVHKVRGVSFVIVLKVTLTFFASRLAVLPP